MYFGTSPIVRNTGGLSDTVTHYNSDTKEGTGFKFNDYDKNGFLWCIDEALEKYKNGEFINIIKNAMECDFSWDKSATEYIALYSELKALKY